MSGLGSNPTLPQTGCVAVDESLNLSVLPIPQLKRGDADNSSSCMAAARPGWDVPIRAGDMGSTSRATVSAH